ncbi:peptide chain release factor 2 [candidate division KSB1 bacterium]|nr:peptide chain release factor 2 [candidate division KSB1 bacterium]
MFEELKIQLTDLKTRTQELGSVFEISRKKNELNRLELDAQAPNFWNDRERAQSILKEMNGYKNWVSAWERVQNQTNDLEVLLEISADDTDPNTQQEIEKDFETLRKNLDDLEFRRMLSEPDDEKNAIFTIHPGAGGTESQDWAQMLMRMYIRWLEKNSFTYLVLDFQSGEEAGIKSVTIEVTGEYAYGFLKAEAGVHRLVRISPFDANKRRHTSFASVFVYPEVNENIEINLNQADLRIDTFRASGAGGQHVNKTSSAVRITHIPTGIVVQCQSERSQHMNRESALKVLMARLYQIKREEEHQKIAAIEKNKKEIAWGNQIRSYVFQPYNLVKDHRTGVETSNIQAVMDGDLDEFIRAFLIGKRTRKGATSRLEEIE